MPADICGYAERSRAFITFRWREKKQPKDTRLKEEGMPLPFHTHMTVHTQFAGCRLPTGRPARWKQSSDVWIRPQSSLLCADREPDGSHTCPAAGCWTWSWALGFRLHCRPNRIPHLLLFSYDWTQSTTYLGCHHLACCCQTEAKEKGTSFHLSSAS